MAEKKRGRVYNKIYTPELWEQVNQDNKDLLDDFLTELRSKKKKKSTIDQYFNDGRIILIYILKELGNKSILELNKKNFRNMTLWMIDKLGVSNARSNRLLSMIHSMLDFAEDDDDYEYNNNISKKVKGLPKEGVREIHFLKDEQIQLLREELRKREEYQKMALLDIAYDSAGRKNELFQIVKQGLLEKNNTNIVIGKRGKTFPLIYFSHSKESIRLWLEQRGEDNIDSLWVTGKDAKREVNNDSLYDWVCYMSDLFHEITGEYIPFNVHSFRHSALENFKNGTHYALKEVGKEKMELNELMVYAHHTDVSTTSSYLRNDENDMIAESFGIVIQ